MVWSAVAADAVLVFHLLFILFALLGGLLVWRWRSLVCLHVPAAVWGVLVELMHWPCPLTPLEQRLRLTAGQAGYRDSFVEHYVLPIIYPAGLTPQIQVLLGLIVLLLNGLIYGVLLWQRWRRS
ncbi:DUF2784 domain-containing protein [Pseudomonas sp. HMWF032]|uniref:DUF2784 domain-containing protein n=1 Tax=Pseudomonas sp. HMWF032 TaxID=2056866 RepID=UPI000D343DB9|nr:DUF2784 domain-containing protein [Pseudomonas sp. HMWF032]PTS83545.1 DUF2784 domain-containing protein [Pseudomonas sp. HMWF032]PTT84095.1 DUF2784 domain-containing protein [Pseudomonas sp. HMWF010]